MSRRPMGFPAALLLATLLMVSPAARPASVSWYSELSGSTYNADGSNPPASRSTEYQTVGLHRDSMNPPWLLANVEGTVDYGFLVASAHAESGSQPDGGVIGSVLSSKLSLEWNDTLTAHGVNGRAELLFTLVLNDTIGGLALSQLPCDGSHEPANCGYVQAQFIASGPQRLLLDNTPGSHSSSISFTGTFDTETPFGITGRLVVGGTTCTGMTYARAAICLDGSRPNDSRAEAYSANGASFFVQSLTPGVTFSSVSGHDYSAPVPEPAGSAMFTAGLALLGAFVRNRSRRYRV